MWYKLRFLAFAWLVLLINPFLGLIFVWIGLYKDRKNRGHYSAMLALVFAGLAYWFVPAHEMDLTRYFQQLSMYSTMPWDLFVSQVLTKSILVLQELLFYAIAQTRNFHLLPAIVVFATYFITLYMITDYAYRNELSSRNTLKVIIVTLCILPFPVIVSNVRNVLSFVIFALAVYRDFEKDKMDLFTIVFYITPLFIHISSLALVILRLLVPIYRTKRTRTMVNIGIITSTYATGLLVTLLQGTFVFSNRLTAGFFLKADSYVKSTNTAYALVLRSSVFLKLQKLFVVGVVFFLALVWMSTIPKREESKLLRFCGLLCFTVLGVAPIVLTVYMRFALPTIILSFCILFSEHLTSRKVQSQLIRISMFLAAVAGVTHQIVFTFQLTDVFHMMTSVMVNNLFSMFLK